MNIATAQGLDTNGLVKHEQFLELTIILTIYMHAYIINSCVNIGFIAACIFQFNTITINEVPDHVVPLTTNAPAY